MSKTFRPWDVDQAWLLPPSVDDFVPAGHPAHLVREIVREELELGAIPSTYEEPRGCPPFHPGMMTALLLEAYAQGIYASRRIAKACAERLDVMAVTGMQTPDLRTIRSSASATSRRSPVCSSRSWTRAGRRAWSSSATSPWTAARSRRTPRSTRR